MIPSNPMTIGASRPAKPGSRVINIKHRCGCAFIKDADTGEMYVPSKNAWVREGNFKSPSDYAKACVFDSQRYAEEYVIIHDLGRVKECSGSSTVVFSLI